VRRPALALAAAVLGPAFLAAAYAHFPVIEPDAGTVNKGDTVKIRYGVGHLFANDRFDVDRPMRVRLYPPGASERRFQDMTAAITSAGNAYVRAYELEFEAKREGDYVLGFECGLYHEPPARKVEDYAKMVIHVRGAQMGWWRRLGHALEIIPLTRPYSIPVGGTFRGRVLDRGQPLAGAFVEAETTPPADGETPVELAQYRFENRTDSDGCFAVTFNTPGWWVLGAATDGGPGMQGGSPHPARRAIFVVFVGEWDDTYRRVFPE
jgi:uncharacterized GH25 family protein